MEEGARDPLAFHFAKYIRFHGHYQGKAHTSSLNRTNPDPNPNPNQVRVIHMISGFRRRNRAPDFVFKRMRYFDQESASWAAW